MPSKDNLYDLLGLPEDATPEEIRRAYREAALRLHPDVNAQLGETELFMQVQQAYATLSDPQKKAYYDQELTTESNEPVDVEILYSRADIPKLDEPQLVYAHLSFSAVEQPNELQTDPPINICLVLDRSTSMLGERMDTVKRAAIELVRHLKAEDMLSLVVFSDRAEVLLPAGKRPDRDMVETQIRMIRSTGGTEIFQGLEAGFTEIRRYASRSFINHIILITDGRTYGDEDACLRLADQAATQGIRITGLGIGTEWNDAFLDELTSRTGGNTNYISQAGDIQKFLADRFSVLSQIYAERVMLHLECGDGVTLNSAFRLQPDASALPINSPIRLGSILKTSKLSVLLEYIVSPIPARTRRLKLANGELSLTRLTIPAMTHTTPIKLTRQVGEATLTELPPKLIFQALSQITLYRMQDRARKDVAEGKVQEASVRLQRLATQLLAIGERELAQTAMVEAERIQKTSLFSAEGEKKIKYGTRSLLLPAHVERDQP